MGRHSSDVSRAPRKLSRTISHLTLTSPRGRSASYRTSLGILVALTCTASATLNAQSSDTVPARLIHVRGDTATLIIPDTVGRGHAFTVTVTAFAGGCIREAGGESCAHPRASGGRDAASCTSGCGQLLPPRPHSVAAENFAALRPGRSRPNSVSRRYEPTRFRSTATVGRDRAKSRRPLIRLAPRPWLWRSPRPSGRGTS